MHRSRRHSNINFINDSNFKKSAKHISPRFRVNNLNYFFLSLSLSSFFQLTNNCKVFKIIISILFEIQKKNLLYQKQKDTPFARHRTTKNYKL